MTPLTHMTKLATVMGILLLIGNGCNTPVVQPQPAGPEVTRIAFGSCMKQNQPQPIWDVVAQQKPDLFLFIGDNIYGDTAKMEVLKKKYDQLGAQPEFKTFREQVPVLATWDDHDYGKNDAGAEYSKKKESKKIMLEFFEEPTDSPRWTHPGIYHSKMFGPEGRRVQIVLLDTRSFRSSPLVKNPAGREGARGPYIATTDRSTTLLGKRQWKWLEQQLQQDADVRIIASSVQVIADKHGWEGWTNFPHERQRLFKLIERSRANGVIFISGDRHLFELSMTDKGPYPLFDLTSSGMNTSERITMDNSNPHRIGNATRRNSFGLIDLDWSGQPTVIHLRVLHKSGKEMLRHSLTLDALKKDW